MSRAGDDGPAASAFPSPRKVGWLFKQGGSGLKGWKKRWFIADHHYLFYYKGPNEKKPVGILCLPEYEACYKVDPSKEYKKPNTFVLDRGNSVEEADGPLKNYTLYSESGSEMQSWVDAIKEEMRPILGVAPASHPALNGGPKKGGDNVKVDPKAFDEVSKLAMSEGPKLTHLTASRPKVKGRRPPKRYDVFHEDDSKEDSPPSTPSPEQRYPSPSDSPGSSPALTKKGHRPSVPLKPKPRTPSTPMLPPVELPPKESEPSSSSEADLPPTPSSPSPPTPSGGSPGVKRFNKPPPPRKASTPDARPVPPKKPFKETKSELAIMERETQADSNSQQQAASIPSKPKGPPTPRKPRSATTSVSSETPPEQPAQITPKPRPRPTPRRRTKTPEPSKEKATVVEEKQDEEEESIQQQQQQPSEEQSIADTPSKTVEEVDKPLPELPPAPKTEDKETPSLPPKTEKTEVASLPEGKEAPLLPAKTETPPSLPPKAEDKQLPQLPPKSEDKQLPQLPPKAEDKQLPQLPPRTEDTQMPPPQPAIPESKNAKAEEFAEQTEAESPKQERETEGGVCVTAMAAGKEETSTTEAPSLLKKVQPEAEPPEAGESNYDQVPFKGNEPEKSQTEEEHDYDLVAFEGNVPEIQASPQRIAPEPLKLEEALDEPTPLHVTSPKLSPGYVPMDPAGSIRKMKSEDNEYVPMREGVWIPEPTVITPNPAHKGTPEDTLAEADLYQKVGDWTAAGANETPPMSPDYLSPNVDYDVPKLQPLKPTGDKNDPPNTAAVAEKQRLENSNISTTATAATAATSEPQMPSSPEPSEAKKTSMNHPSSASSTGSRRFTSSRSDLKTEDSVDADSDLPPPPIPPQDSRLSFSASISSNSRHETIERDPFGYSIVKKDSRTGLIPDDRSASYSSQRTATSSSSWSPAPPLPPANQRLQEHTQEGEEELDISRCDSVPNALRQAMEILRLAKAVKAEAEEMKSEALRELELARSDKRDAEILKTNAAEILKMAKERLSTSGSRR